MIGRPPRSTRVRSSAASDVYKRQAILRPDGVPCGPPDRRTRLPGYSKALPGHRRLLDFGTNDLDLVAVPERCGKRHGPAIDLDADAGVAHAGVDRVGKVDAVRAARQRNEPSLRRETEHLILKQLELGVLEKLFRVVALQQHADEMAQPTIGVGVL